MMQKFRGGFFFVKDAAWLAVALLIPQLFHASPLQASGAPSASQVSMFSEALPESPPENPVRNTEGAWKFPDGFKWCVSTAAYQVEGDNTHSDWSEWEKQPGKIQGNQRSGAACDEWGRYDEDIGMLQELHVQTYRFSVEWSKIEPSEGVFDPEALAHYQKEIALLRKAGIEPMVTLQHFTLPQWVAAQGGWEWEGITPAFEIFVKQVYASIGDSVRDWITINEPMVDLVASYYAGLYPPGKTSMKLIPKPLINMLKAHAAAYHALHNAARVSGRQVRVGVANHLRIFDPYHPHEILDRYAAGILDQAFNWSFLDAITTGRLTAHIPFLFKVNEKIPNLAGTQDFIGVNYYSRDMVQGQLSTTTPIKLWIHPNSLRSDLGWEIYPAGLYLVLTSAHARYPRIPIIITENGVADSKDTLRPGFIVEHLKQLLRAIQEGVPVEGYCHWSSMDNFEWTLGYTARFGLYAVDFDTEERTLRKSGELFSQIAAANRITDPSISLPLAGPYQDRSILREDSFFNPSSFKSR